ncbi:hypothetical protein D3C73_1132880 [compost metagenome]
MSAVNSVDVSGLSASDPVSVSGGKKAKKVCSIFGPFLSSPVASISVRVMVSFRFSLNGRIRFRY